VTEALRRVEQERALAQQTLALDHSHRQLEHSLELLRATMDATQDGLLVVDCNGNPRQINRQLVELWRIPQPLTDLQAGQALLDHLHSQVRDTQAIRFDPQHTPETASVLELHDGRAIEYLGCAHRLHGVQVGTVYSFRDVTQRLRSAALIRHQATHDRVSGLPNRYQFDEALTRAVAEARSTQGNLALLFMDLDNFKAINDTLGHDTGDLLLLLVAERLRHSVRAEDLVARWGGDEFTVLVPTLRDPEYAVGAARRILDALTPPFQLGNASVHVSASIGVATYPLNGDDGPALLRHADRALYRVKAAGRNGIQQ
jgi:diguanylate cyclase (GGDEF)-like protein